MMDLCDILSECVTWSHGMTYEESDVIREIVTLFDKYDVKTIEDLRTVLKCM